MFSLSLSLLSLLDLLSTLLTVITVSFGSPPALLTVMERDGMTSDICINVTNVPTGGVECPFDIVILPTAMIDAGKCLIKAHAIKVSKISTALSNLLY